MQDCADEARRLSGAVIKIWPVYQNRHRKKVLGPERPNTNRSRHNFARPKRSRTTTLHWPPTKSFSEKIILGPRTRARVTADALAALGRAEEAVALRERYGIGGDPPVPALRPFLGRGGSHRGQRRWRVPILACRLPTHAMRHVREVLPLKFVGGVPIRHSFSAF